MTTIGDTFGIAAILVGLCVTAWAIVMGFTLTFSVRAAAARDNYQTRPWLGFVVGLGLALTVGIFGVVVSAIPNPVAKMFGVSILMALVALSAVGTGGLSLLVSSRIRMLDSNVTPYGALVKASAVIMIGAFFPALGWFLIAPALLVTSLGVGFLSLLTARQVATEPHFDEVK